MTEAMAAALPNARVETVKGGHIISPTSPLVLSFLAEVLEGR